MCIKAHVMASCFVGVNQMFIQATAVSRNFGFFQSLGRNFLLNTKTNVEHE